MVIEHYIRSSPSQLMEKEFVCLPLTIQNHALKLHITRFLYSHIYSLNWRDTFITKYNLLRTKGAISSLSRRAKVGNIQQRICTQSNTQSNTWSNTQSNTQSNFKLCLKILMMVNLYNVLVNKVNICSNFWSDGVVGWVGGGGGVTCVLSTLHYS